MRSGNFQRLRTLPLWCKTALAGVALVAVTAMVLGAAEYVPQIIWDTPPVIDPGTAGGPPSDALVLFGGKDMSQWNNADKWTVEGDHVISGGNDIQTKKSFGDCQLHVEWAAPKKVEGRGQGRGNSGVYMMGQYEIQVLDCYNNETYVDGEAGSVYKQHPPMVNACRKPGEWQTYDIIFNAPKFSGEGKLLKPAYVTVLHNGVLVQNHFEIQGQTSYIEKAAYHAHPDKLPITLQFHGNPVQYRNIWIREIKELKSVPGKRNAQP